MKLGKNMRNNKGITILLTLGLTILLIGTNISPVMSVIQTKENNTIIKKVNYENGESNGVVNSFNRAFGETQAEYEKRIEAFQRYEAGDETVKEQDMVAVTRWAGGDNVKPQSYQDAKVQDAKVIRPLFNVQKQSEEKNRDSATLYVLVDEALYEGLASYLTRYQSDVESEGIFSVEIYSGTYGTPEELRLFLQGLPNIAGAFFIGDIPAAWFEHEYFDHEEFPIDLFYMDLDGIWADTDYDGIYDSHTGNVGPDIWVGRLDATSLPDSSIELYQNYFDKNHAYRTGELKLPVRALNYVDDDWAGYWGTQWNNNMASLYQYRTLVDERDGTNVNDYKNRLTWDYEWISVFVHSCPWYHEFFSNSSGGQVTSEDICNINPHGLFYNLFACSAARFNENNYIAGRYLFADTFGLGVVGSTKIGSMLVFDKFYQPLATGKTLGEAFKDWFNYIAKSGFSEDEIGWHYGMVLLGDPTLHPRMSNNNIPISYIRPSCLEDYSVYKRTIYLMGTAKRGFNPDSTFSHYTISWGEGINPSVWYETGITLANGGLVEVNNGYLGDIDTTIMKDSLNTIKVTVVDCSGQESNYKTVIMLDNTYFLSPEKNRPFRAGDVIDLQGSALGADFDHYEILFGKGFEPNSWSSEGIVLENNGEQSVYNGPLGTWDTTGIVEAGVYTIRLISYNAGLQKTADVPVFIDPLFKNGWPKRLNDDIYIPTVTVTNIDASVEKEIVFATSVSDYFGWVYIYNHDGTSYPGWPNNIQGSRIPIAFEDINSDGQKEVLVATANLLRAYQLDGIQLPESFSAERSITCLLSFADVDHDQNLDLFTAHRQECGGVCIPGNTHGLKNLQEFGQWPALYGSAESKLAIGDVNGDGFDEIVSSAGTDNPLMIFDCNGNILQSFTQPGSFNSYCSYPTLTDLDHDGMQEILVGGWYGETQAEFYRLYAYNSDGTDVPGWPVSVDLGYLPYSPVVADLNGDGNIEVIYVTHSGIYILNEQGELLRLIALDCCMSPVVGDIDGNGLQEIIAVRQEGDSSRFAQLYALNSDGSVVDGFPRYMPPMQIEAPGLMSLSLDRIGKTPVITDLDGDGKVDIVLGSDKNLMVWELSTPYNEQLMDWPSYRHDNRMTGRYESTLIPGDLDHDGDIDYDDYVIFLAAFGHSQGQPEYNLYADLDHDGTVSLVDYQLWRQCYQDYVGDPNAPLPTRPGDMNFDGQVDLRDINPFVLALSNPQKYHTTYPLGNILNGDINLDGAVNFGDINPFVALLIG